MDNLTKIDGPIEKMFLNLNAILHDHDNAGDTFSCLKNVINDIESVIDQTLDRVSNYIQAQLKELNYAVILIIDMIIHRARKNEDFDLNNIRNNLFQGYNGLGTSYIVFHELSEH